MNHLNRGSMQNLVLQKITHFFSGLILFFGLLLQAKEFQKPYVLFGEDDRQEVFTLPSEWQVRSRAIAGKVSKEHLVMNQSTIELSGAPLSKKICPSNRFAQQITVPSCTGFLAKPNILITAGHCVKSQEDCDQFVWVFGYQLLNEGDKNYTHVKTNQVYSCRKIHNRRFEDFGAVDYAIIELDRPVEGRTPLALGFQTPVSVSLAVTSIGHPSGLPLKFIDSATVLELADGERTLATDLDAFQGNSGSPVFDAATGTVIGITSHGHADHVRDPVNLCKIPKVCRPGDQCHLSAASRITNLINEPILQ